MLSALTICLFLWSAGVTTDSLSTPDSVSGDFRVELIVDNLFWNHTLLKVTSVTDSQSFCLLESRVDSTTLPHRTNSGSMRLYMESDSVKLARDSTRESDSILALNAGYLMVDSGHVYHLTLVRQTLPSNLRTGIEGSHATSLVVEDLGIAYSADCVGCEWYLNVTTYDAIEIKEKFIKKP